MADSPDEIDVSLDVNRDLDDDQQAVIDAYEQNIETFLRKNENYNNSFVNSARIESLLKHGEVRDDEIGDIVARQIFVRGMLDKLSRFYTLQFTDEEDRVDEEVQDTLLDMGNYAVMLAAMLERYN
jgi:hypothetical protein